MYLMKSGGYIIPFNTNVVKMQLAWRGRSRDMVPYSEIEANEHGA
jgi:ribosome modulation factor